MVTKEQEEEIKKLVSEGMNTYRVAKNMGLRYIQVYYLLHKDYFRQKNKEYLNKKRAEKQNTAQTQTEPPNTGSVQNEQGGGITNTPN
jgi:hypothetical protein